MRTRICVSLLAALALSDASASAASADGLPVPVDYTWGEGVVNADGSSRFVTIGTGDRTLVMRISTDDGEVVDHDATEGAYTVPAIAVDGTASGISADGGTLALISPRRSFPRRTTELLVYDAERLRKTPERIELEGDFSFDALSPDGETLYLVEYTNRRDPGAYQVRAFDLTTQELAPHPILDSEEEPGEMRGFPQTRATSPDGRWEYTLYDGGEHPFIHALDVVEGATVCIDLEMIGARDTYGATLEPSDDGASLELSDRRGDVRALVDTESFEVTEPDSEPEPTDASSSGSEPTLAIAGLAAGGLALVAFAGLRLRRMRN